MKQSMTRKLRLLATTVCLSAMLVLAGCGETAQPESSTTESQESTSQEQSGQEQNQGGHLSSLLGKWEMIAEISTGYYEYFQDSGCTIEVYEEDGKYRLDYIHNWYDYTELCGMVLEETTQPKYAGLEAADWYGVFSRKTASNVTYQLVKLTEDTVKLQIHAKYSYEEDGQTVEDAMDTYYVYVKADSPNREQVETEYQYRNTVTVSNTLELFQAVADNTRIILKAGEYNISELTPEERCSANLNHDRDYETGEEISYPWDSLYAADMHDIMLEGEEGAEVIISTEDAYAAPLYFMNCSRISLKNLTVGHDVEPGYCAGSVLALSSTNNVRVENCRLYGSGTYGIEAESCYDIRVENSDIYECTYGLVRLYSTGRSYFRNCTLKDSVGFTMFSLDEVWDTEFKDCAIRDNFVSYEDEAFISANDGGVTFDSCTFQGNRYSYLKNGSVTMKNCTLDDN